MVKLNTQVDKLVFTVLDTETTGVNPGDAHEIIEVGMVHFSEGKKTDSYQTLIRSVQPQLEEARAIHKIPPEELAGAPSAEVVIDDVIAFIGDTVIAAHNVNFDMTFLDTTLRKLRRPILYNWAIDTIFLSQKVWPHFPCHCLMCLWKSLELPHQGNHRALQDALETAELLGKIISEMPGKGVLTLNDLQPSRGDYTWKTGDIHRERERALRKAIETSTPIHITCYNPLMCQYFGRTVVPIGIAKDIIRVRVPGEAGETEFPLYDIVSLEIKTEKEKDHGYRDDRTGEDGGQHGRPPAERRPPGYCL